MPRTFMPAVALVALVAATPALADTYTQADFSAGIRGGNANVKLPFTDDFYQGEPFTGSFVYDNDLIPAAGSGTVNVAWNNYPDAADIPAADLFKLNFGGLTFTAADAIAGNPFGV